jgi:Phosphoenolpyruvate phosphomutase/Eukaryotic-type carbonic anhydrase
MSSQADKGRAFRALHSGPKAFIIPNPWDVGTARLLAQLGFSALATTSAGYAFSLGVSDNAVARDTMMEHLASIASATELPVSADLANGYGDSCKTVEEEITGVAVNPAGLLPHDTRYYTYRGSQTAPPCSEGVAWFVLKTPVDISADEISAFAKLYPHDVRPPQPLNGRVVKASR